MDFRSRPVIQAALVAAIFAGVGVGRTPAVVADTTTFVPLDNGTDFTGWRFADQAATPREIPSAWKIESGVIVGTGDPTAILASQWDYGDFELEFEWRADADTVDADVYAHASRMLDADPGSRRISPAGRRRTTAARQRTFRGPCGRRCFCLRVSPGPAAFAQTSPLCSDAPQNRWSCGASCLGLNAPASRSLRGG